MRGHYSEGFAAGGAPGRRGVQADRGAVGEADEALVERFKRILLDEVDLHELGRLDDGQRRVRLERVMAHLVSREGVALMLDGKQRGFSYEDLRAQAPFAIAAVEDWIARVAASASAPAK